MNTPKRVSIATDRIRISGQHLQTCKAAAANAVTEIVNLAQGAPIDRQELAEIVGMLETQSAVIEDEADQQTLKGAQALNLEPSGNKSGASVDEMLTRLMFEAAFIAQAADEAQQAINNSDRPAYTAKAFHLQHRAKSFALQAGEIIAAID